MLRTSLLYLGILLVQLCAAQQKFNKKEFTKDSLAIVKPPLVKPQLRIDNRQVYFKQQLIAMNGVDAGILLKEKLRLTIGYHWLNDVLDFYRTTMNNVQVDRQIKFKYASINTEFIYLHKRYYSLGVPLEFGFGENQLVYRDYATAVTYSPVQKGFVFITDFGLSATFKPLRWLGIKGSVGYRKNLINGVKDFHFNGFFTSLGLNADLRELLVDFRMFNLKRKYKRGNNISNAVDLITE